MISHPVHNVRPKNRGDTLPAADFNRVVSAVQAALRRRSARGFGSNDFFLERPPPRLVALQPFPGQVYAALSYAPNRWLYALREMAWNTDSANWAIKTGGRTTRAVGNDFAKPAINGCEAGNNGTGIETVGVNFDAEPLASSTFEVIEIKNSPVVAVFPMPRLALGVPGGPPSNGRRRPPGGGGPTLTEAAYWFSVPNVIDGGCAPIPASPFAGSTGSECSCLSCCLSASEAGPGLAVLDNGQIIVRLGPGLKYSGKDVAVRTSGMVYATDAGGVELHPPRLGVYDASGGQAIIGTRTVTLDTLHIDDVDTTDLRGKALEWTKSDEVLVKARGRLIVDYRLSVSIGTGTHEGRAFLDHDAGAGYVDVPGTDSWISKRGTGTVKLTAAGYRPLDVAAGDLVRFRAQRTAGLGALTTIAGGSALSAVLERT